MVPASSASNSHIVRFSVFELDTSSGELRRSGHRVALQDQPLRVLIRLLERPGELVSREALQRELWPDASFGDFEHGLNAAIKRLRDTLEDTADNPRFVETLPKRGYRFIAPILTAHSQPKDLADGFMSRRRVHATVSGGVAIGLAGVALFLWMHSTTSIQSTIGLTVVVADFVNHTGDTVFDDALRQALRTEIEQSPSFRVVSGERVRQILREMLQSADERVTGDLALEVCQRVGAEVLLRGTVAAIGTRFAVGLEASDCQSKDTIAEQRIDAADREHVVDALGQVAVDVRRRLGESAASVRRFAVPIREATTSSLEALKAFSVAEQVRARQGDAVAEPFYHRAIELDPEFAMPYVALWAIHGNASRFDAARRSAVEAYARRERVTERERFRIDSGYCAAVMRRTDPSCFTNIHELWKRTYPLDSEPYQALCLAYHVQGDYAKAVLNGREALRLAPDNWISYATLIDSLFGMNRFDEAKQVANEASTHHLAGIEIYIRRFLIAMVDGDSTGMASARDAIRGAPDEFKFVARDAEAAAFEGRIREARTFRDRAARLAGSGFPAWKADMNSFAAMTDAAFGYRPCERVQEDVVPINVGERADARASNPLMIALICEDYASADRLLNRFRENANIVGPASALIAVSRGSGADIARLAPSSPTELGTAAGFRSPYLRGLAYLRAGDGPGAATAFQQILDHRGTAITSPLFPLAYVQQARAFTLAGDLAKARKAYESFFYLWRRADPDVPVLIAARDEYRALIASH